MEEVVMATSESVVCTLTEDELRERRAELRSGLFASITAARETSDGVELTFPAESADMVRAFVAAERQCCGFMTFTIDSRDDRARLRVSGPEGTKEFVRNWVPERVRKATRDSGRLFKAGGGSLLGAVGAIVLCETPLLAAMLAGVGAGAAVGRVSSWLDAGGVILAAASVGFVCVAWYRRRHISAHHETGDDRSCGSC